MSAALRVLAIRPLDGSTSVKAFVDVQLGGVTIRGARIIHQEGKDPWLAMPAVKTGRGWQNVVDLSKELRERLTDLVLAQWAAPSRIPSATPGQASQEAVRERADEVVPVIFGSKADRDRRIAELAEQFDRRGPDEVPF